MAQRRDLLAVGWRKQCLALGWDGMAWRVPTVRLMQSKKPSLQKNGKASEKKEGRESPALQRRDLSVEGRVQVALGYGRHGAYHRFD